jgi:hypothetical protein
MLFLDTIGYVEEKKRVSVDANVITRKVIPTVAALVTRVSTV